MHPDIQIIPLGVARADVLHIRVALDGFLPDTRALGGAVAPLALAAYRLTKQLDQHRVINLAAESGIDRVDIRLQTIGRYLNAVGKALRQIINNFHGRSTVAASNVPTRN